MVDYPAPDIYLEACKMIGAEPPSKKSYESEDSRNGLISAYRTGCKPIMIPDLWQPDEEIMKIFVAKYHDLEQVKAAFENGEI